MRAAHCNTKAFLLACSESCSSRAAVYVAAFAAVAAASWRGPSMVKIAKAELSVVGGVTEMASERKPSFTFMVSSSVLAKARGVAMKGKMRVAAITKKKRA